MLSFIRGWGVTEDEVNIFDMSTEAILMAALNQVTLGAVAQECSSFMEDLKGVHPVKSAAAFGCLLLQKKLQPNCLRLEVLVHLSLAKGQGERALSPAKLMQGYSNVGDACGTMEDPPEDIFVGNVSSKVGNYKVLEGIWEGGTFYLQRFVNLADELPEELSEITKSIHALLKLSDVACSRAGLVRNELGDPHGEESLPKKYTDTGKYKQLIKFKISELEALGIDFDDLLPFLFDPRSRAELLGQVISNTDLEARPLAKLDDSIYLVLPTAVSIAVRRYFIESLGTGKGRRSFLYHLGNEYSRAFDESTLLGEHLEPIPFSHMDWGSVCCMSRQVDVGRYFNLIFVIDAIEDYPSNKFSGMFTGNPTLSSELKRAITEMQDYASGRPGFRDGLTLLICCGVGRGVAIDCQLKQTDKWEFEFLSAHDFCSLSKVRGINSLDLWRILQARDQLAEQGVWIQNINGFLNLYAWAESLGGHLVPHGEVPESSEASTMLHMAITQNAILDIRYEIVNSVDAHVQRFIDGTWRLLRKEGNSYFSEDDEFPLYGSVQLEQGVSPLGAFITKSRCWWYELSSPKTGLDTGTYDRWKMVGTWLKLAANPLDDFFRLKLGSGPILWRCIFENLQGSVQVETPGEERDATESIDLVVNKESRIIELYIGSGFERAIYHKENIAERALVTTFLRGVAELASPDVVDISDLIKKVIPDVYARHSHMFPQRQFRDFIPEIHKLNLVEINKIDDAANKIGMGWLFRSPSEGGRIVGKENCRDFLNGLIRRLESELCKELRLFNKKSFLEKLIVNHEVAAASRDRWHRTAAAVVALRKDKVAALQTMRDHEFKLNAVFQPTRNLIEMVICESPVEGGHVLGDLDLSRLLAKASRLYHFGGWSDLIRWDLLEPLLIVQPLGDVHAKHEFMDTVMEGFGRAASEYRYKSSIEGYSQNLDKQEVIVNAEEKLDSKFVEAWMQEFGVTIDQYRRFIDAVENVAIEKQSSVVSMTVAQLIALSDTEEVGRKIVENLTLHPRSTWRDLPEGYDEKDIAPWRFRRRLSALRRPLFKLSKEDDSALLVAPGLLRDGFSSMFGNYYRASYPDWHLGPAMRRYAGYARNRDGMSFNTQVASRMAELGWQSKPEVNVTKILSRALERNYGDVDVLAWSEERGRILVIECKDLQFRKTYGEIAEQLSDFRGECSSDGSRRDLLRKHLDRVSVLTENIQEVRRFVGCSDNALIESIIVFRHPVPMQSAEGPIREHADLYIYDELDKI